MAAGPQVNMSDITEKETSLRQAQARGSLRMSDPEAFEKLTQKALPKGDALGTAKVAAIMAAKRTSDLIPLCHPIALENVDIEFSLHRPSNCVTVFARVCTSAKTGVEMEALSAVNGALLCLYDMIKPVDPALCLEGIRLVEKIGGKKGHWRHPEEVRHD